MNSPPRREHRQFKRGRLHTQPPSLLSSLCEITELQVPVPGQRRRQPVRLRQTEPPLPELTQPVPILPPPLPCDGDAPRDDAVRSTSSSTR
jgi:hypothetical protein